MQNNSGWSLEETGFMVLKVRVECKALVAEKQALSVDCISSSLQACVATHSLQPAKFHAVSKGGGFMEMWGAGFKVLLS